MSLLKLVAFVLLVGVGLSFLGCTKRLSGDTSYAEANKGFEKQLTRVQRDAATKQLQTQTAGGANRP
jgi:hypothetical protein